MEELSLAKKRNYYENLVLWLFVPNCTLPMHISMYCTICWSISQYGVIQCKTAINANIEVGLIYRTSQYFELCYELNFYHCRIFEELCLTSAVDCLIILKYIDKEKNLFWLHFRYFMYDGLKHTCIEGNHIVNLFSFSKAYGMMGWRVGYVSRASKVDT